MITIKALPPSRRPSLLPRASNQGFAQSIMQKYRHGEGRDPGYLALIHRDFSTGIGGRENHFYQTFIHVRMQVQMDSYLGLNREMLPNGQAGLPGSKERVVMTQASGSGRKVRPAALMHELFQKWESSKLIEKVYLPRITVVSNGTDRYHWSSYVQSSVQRGSETYYVLPELLVHTARMGDPGERRSMQNARERIWFESATRIDAISISRVRETRSEEGRFEQSGVRYFLQLIGRGMQPRIGTWSFPVLQKRTEVRTPSSFLDRSVRTERAGDDSRDIGKLIVPESESTRWSVAPQQAGLWGRWWENLGLYWKQNRARTTWLPRTMTAHPRLRVLQPIVFPRSRQHPQVKSQWMLETLSEVYSSPLERKILQSNELSKMFSSLLPSMFRRTDASRTKEQAARERLKQLFLLAQQFSKAEIDPVHAVHGSRQSLKQIERGREQQPRALSHLLRQLVSSREQQAAMLVSQIEQEQQNSVTFHQLQQFPFESIATRNQRTYEILQQLISQEAKLNEIVREQSIRLRSSHEQTHFGKTSMSPAVSRASYQQLDRLQHEWRTGLSLHVLHPMQGLPFQLRMGQAQTAPLLSQSVVRKSIAAYWILSFRSANAPVFFEKRGWMNQSRLKEYLETLNEIEREPAGIASTARFVWNRFVPVFRVNRQLWQTLQNRAVSFVHHKTNEKSVMEWVHLQLPTKQLRARELLATRTHAPRNLRYEPENQSPYPAANTPSRWLMHLLNVLTKESAFEGISQPFFQPAIYFLQNKHVLQMSYEMVRQLLSSQGGRDKRTGVAFSFSKNQEKFSLPERKATTSMLQEHEYRPIRHTVFLKNERSTSRAFVHTHRHNREAVSLRLNRFDSAMLRSTEWIGLGGTGHQRLYSTSAKPFSIREDASDRNSLRWLAAGWSAELGLTILLQKSTKLAAMSEFVKVGSTSTSGKAPPSSEKQSNDQSKSIRGESNQLLESRQSRESSHSRFLQQTASLWTSSVALRAHPYPQVIEQTRKAIQTDFRTKTYVHNHNLLSAVLNRHAAQMVVQKQWGSLPSLLHGNSVGALDSFMHENGSRRASERLPRKGRVNSLELLTRPHPIRFVPFAREKSIALVMDRLHSRQLSRRSRFQQTSHGQILTVNRNTHTIKRLTSDEAQGVEIQDARLTPFQRTGLFNLASTSMAIQPPLLQALQQAQRAHRESKPHSLSENATHIHRRALRTEDSHASPAATVQSPPSMEYLRKSIPPQEPAVQQATTLPLQRQVDLHVQERAGNQTSLSPQEVDRLMDKVMKELDKRLTQERQRRGL